MKLLLLLTALVAGVLSKKTFIGEQVLRIKANSNEQLSLLQDLQSFTHLQLDFWTEPAKSDIPVDIRVPFTSLQFVKAYLEYNNFDYSIMIENLQQVINTEKEELESNERKERNSGSFDFGAYHTLDTINYAIDLIIADYSSIVSKQQIGNSYEGRPLNVLKFSTGANHPGVWIDAGIHSREWVTQATALWTARKLASDYGKDASITSLLDNYDVFLMVVTNPDGYVYTHTTNRMWRKTRSINKGSACEGADPNRNWDAGFGGPGADSNPCSETYHGSSAESEVEVKSIANFIRSHGKIKGFITIHSYSQFLLFPYGYKRTLPADYAELNKVGNAAASALTSLYGTQYKVGTIVSTIYQASGGSIDWSYDIGIKYSFAFELRDQRRYGFLLPASQILPTAQETYLALKKILEHIRDNPY
ncbi:carboxypeptidase A2-like isoform X3 [Rana temporaria]|uniref:carboxypeptidase A2-like isoform X3 n=1 Tax=Rana temporaria TaxID=8407 RepID=UPI001AAC8510|nr:carboxypeptidase A2-like isoform X3 [Rana temporaria]XP_040199273.1 carboxypeptidase A2-like isoform X3 [Rana temporaria]XP_040199274.1 carboxypeptidase A2-like isoform X3 [Rana temporaria]